MKLFRGLAFGLLAVALFASAQQDKPAEKKAESKVLKVKLNYTGSGVVDAKHPIFLFLFDSADFMQGGVMPVGAGSATAKDETVSFPDLDQATIYVVATYDPKGEYDGQSGPPPSGSSMGMYQKTPGTPEPIKLEPGKTVEVELVFDDTAKMP